MEPVHLIVLVFICMRVAGRQPWLLECAESIAENLRLPSITYLDSFKVIML